MKLKVAGETPETGEAAKDEMAEKKEFVMLEELPAMKMFAFVADAAATTGDKERAMRSI